MTRRPTCKHCGLKGKMLTPSARQEYGIMLVNALDDMIPLFNSARTNPILLGRASAWSVILAADAQGLCMDCTAYMDRERK